MFGKSGPNLPNIGKVPEGPCLPENPLHAAPHPPSRQFAKLWQTARRGVDGAPPPPTYLAFPILSHFATPISRTLALPMMSRRLPRFASRRAFPRRFGTLPPLNPASRRLPLPRIRNRPHQFYVSYVIIAVFIRRDLHDDSFVSRTPHVILQFHHDWRAPVPPPHRNEFRDAKFRDERPKRMVLLPVRLHPERPDRFPSRSRTPQSTMRKDGKRVLFVHPKQNFMRNRTLFHASTAVEDADGIFSRRNLHRPAIPPQPYSEIIPFPECGMQCHNHSRNTPTHSFFSSEHKSHHLN